ncbi:hypothetical protein CPB86DRAFT_712097 [Serendipita vermifera]|nr:hypothetical protein CPB86DRAFT_712097 [Serendipita vermifera]
MSIHILLSNNSVRNVTASCDSLGIHYEVSREHDDGVITVHRWESLTNSNVLVGQFKLPFFGRDKVKLAGDPEWRPLGEFLIKKRNPFSTTRTFRGNSGNMYKWKTKWGRLVMCHAAKDISRKPLVRYHRHYTEQSYLEILDSSVLPSLDNLFVAFLIMEKKRRDREKTRRSHGGGGP